MPPPVLADLVQPGTTALILQEVQDGVVGASSALPALAEAGARIGMIPNIARLATAARAVGVDARRMKTLVYLATAFMTGIAGALIYVQKARISPDAAFSVLDWTAYVIFIVVIGGIGTLEGPVVGAVIFYLMQRFLADLGASYLILLGTLGILVMLFAPKGLWGLVAERYGLTLLPTRRRLVIRDGGNG